MRKKKERESNSITTTKRVWWCPCNDAAEEATFHCKDVNMQHVKRIRLLKMLQTGNYSLVLLIQLTLLAYDLFVNSFSELLRGAPVIQLVLFIIQDIAILFNVIIILLMMFNTYVFQVGLVSLLLERFRALLMFSALYLTLSICLHCWVLNLRWLESNRFVWTDGLEALFVFQRTAAVLYYYLYKRTAEYMGDPRLYEDSLWLRDAFARSRQ
ncbi:transmembrane protein 138 isoform X1 [Lates calcarifer]|uniref:Transmembrane protein 138 n=4 Tax=Lates TaxID=8186 RepID=A0AAJ7V694_LATCA|nr:transmembrane protein 138 isoform X1 [Lates calcarifer]